MCGELGRPEVEAVVVCTCRYSVIQMFNWNDWGLL